MLIGSFSVSGGLLHPQNQPAAVSSAVPFVGCASDGQVGPLPAPEGKSLNVQVAPEIAARLAYYKAEYGYGVLAPRGWHCFSTYGSSGSSLFVAPEPLDGRTLLSPSWKGFGGDAIQLSVAQGDTSGRFEVAKTIARVFPGFKWFVHHVISEHILPSTAFPSGKYADDILTYRSKSVVEFETRPNGQGLGTHSRLRIGPEPIRGVAIVAGAETSLVQASLRISGESRAFTDAILQQVENEVAASKK